MKILIFGKGFIGQRLLEELNCELTERRITQIQDIVEEIDKYKPDVIINCIGYTGESNVDDCETNINKTIMANTFVPIMFAEAAMRTGVKLVHISSGCIYEYDYEKDVPIEEEKIPDYIKLYYSRTKTYAERALEVFSKKANILILRIRIPLDNRPTGRDILSKLIKYKNVIDVENSVTYIPDFIKAVEHLILIDARGIYNVVLKGGLRYKDLLNEYIKYVPGFDYNIIKELNLNRTNLILSTDKLEKTGFKVRTIQEVIRECVLECIKFW